MAFQVTKKDLIKSQKCPPGMHIFELITVDEPYLKDNGVTVQKCEFESDTGHIVPVWFNSSVMDNMFEFVQAADKITLNPETMGEMEIELKDYLHKKVAGMVSHGPDKNGKIQHQIDNFYNADKVPF